MCPLSTRNLCHSLLYTLCVLQKVPLVLIIAFSYSPKGEVKADRNVTCPLLEHCRCQQEEGAFFVKCISPSVDAKFYAGISKLQGLFVRKMHLEHLNVTELPRSWFTDHRISRLKIPHSGLRNVAAICLIKQLYFLQLDGNELEGIPTCLCSAKVLRWLEVRRNRIRRLNGTLVLPELRRLDFRRNAIATIDEGYFSGLPKLLYLLLSKNNIQMLSPNLFRKITSLRGLQLNSNRISSVEGVFNCLGRLEVLELSDNKICDMESLSRHTLPRLKYLKELFLEQNCISLIPKLLSSKSHIRRLILRSNSLTSIVPGAFSHLVQLTTLDLRGNSIASLSGSYFARHSVLEVLNLSTNNIAAISTLFNRTRWIKEINLSFNRIVDISVAFNGLTELRELLLKSNKISSIPDATFQDNIRLVHIDLTSNNIAWIGRDAFKGLLTLKMLRLHRNRIISLNFSASNLPKLQYFGASHNAISRLENGEFRNNAAMTAISLEHNNIAYVERAFIGTTGLLSLNLAGNQVQLLRRSDFALKLAGCAAVTIDNNPLICDCRLAWLMEEDSGIRVRGMAACAKPWWLEGRPVRVLQQEDFFRWKEDCQPGCRCECHEGSLGGREINVNCSSATVGRIPKVLPEGTTQLDLSVNQLRNLDEAVRKVAPNLQVLSLKENALSSIDVASVPKTVNTLDLRRNNLQQLPLLLVAQLNLTSIWLSGNEYVCECADYSFKQWIEGHRNVIPDASDIVCGKSDNPLVSGKKFITLGQHDLCPATLPQGAVYVLLACGLLAVLLALSATYLRYGVVLKAWLHMHGVCGWACCDEEDDTQKLFDVFVSFSSKDIDFIHDEILPELDAMGLSYCTYERNFKGGYLLQDIIRDAVAYSRRTLLVLTQNFVDSEWCRLEFRMAHQRALEDNINRLVIVLVEELELNVLDKDLRLYVRGANYLRWGEPNFWDRMLHSLATREARRKVIVKREQRPRHLAASVSGDIALE